MSYTTHGQLLNASAGILLRMGLVGIAFGMLWLDLAVFQTQILEISFTEITQEAMLFVCAALFWTAPGSASERGFKVLAGGFFACLLMRELDGLFDPISHSAWCWPFCAIALFCIWKAFKPGIAQNSLDALAAFTRTPMFGSISTCLGILIFSRIFGTGALWHIILDEGYARLAKTAAEEGVELLTYSMWLAAVIEYFVAQRSAVARPQIMGELTGESEFSAHHREVSH
ncbi:hypothetical protein NPS29_00350 [Pseudomonas putida]|uniref:hypothetical protein n=1 Tax=Pseudomonas putida TaxID=303 RepID=UPI0023647FC1|nr:hypothetical protein [Pseudomonas putida]MDD1963761.1 hypothetical protein [Pseudomonas putida]